MSFYVLRTGIPPTIQDAGRYGHRSSGVPVSGPMDRNAFQSANLLCGNEPGFPALEITLHGLALRVTSECLIACCGGGARLFHEQDPLPMNRPLRVQAGVQLNFLADPAGCRSYLAVAGGFCATRDLGSCSTYEPALLGGLGGRPVRAGDLLESTGLLSAAAVSILQSLKNSATPVCSAPWGLASPGTSIGSPVLLRVLRGPEWEAFSPTALHCLMTESFTVSAHANRMGYRLEGPVLTLRRTEEMVSTAVTMGTLQVTHEGHPVLLMADAQTIGGYPRIAQVAAVDLPYCGQLRPGDRIRFQEIGWQEATAAWLSNEQLFRRLRLALSVRWG